MTECPPASSHADGPPPGEERLVYSELARAKVNLTLEIKGRRADGYHELESLVVFADLGDVVEYRPGGDFALRLSGPFAGALHGDNLVARAADLFAELTAAKPGGEFHLTKNIPVAAGLGGGSADAAAALRLLNRRSAPLERSVLAAAASKIGADVPCCLLSRAAVMTGIGEILHPLPPVTPVPAILVNPLMPLATSDVFRELAAAPLTGKAAERVMPRFSGPAELAAYAAARSNDLEGPARRLLPAIGGILDALSAAPGALLARLSGSGPTCFALFASHADAEAAAAAIAREHPRWWVRAVTLS